VSAPAPVTMHVAGHPSLGALLTDALLTHPGRVVLVEARRKRETARHTAGEVLSTSRRLAAALQARGVGPGSRVALLMSNQSRWPMTALAVFLAGATLVPLDYKLTGPEQRALVEHSGAQVVVLEYGEWRKHPDGLGDVATVVSEAPAGEEGFLRWEELAGGDTSLVEHPVGPDDIACIVYSSGTGGRPKGCMLPHRAYLTQLDALLERFPMAEGDHYFSILPSNHAIDFMVGFVGPFVCGATVVHQRSLRPELLRWTMRRYGITHMAVVPLILTAFERSIREKLDETSGWKKWAFEGLKRANVSLTERRPNHGLSRRLLQPVHEAFGGKLRLLFCGGAFTDRSQAEFFYELGIPVVIGYGLTEACTVVSVHGLSPFRADGVGRPVAGTEVRIHEPDGDGVGEVCVRGETLMKGYLDDPGQTAEVLRDGWLHTGDLGYLDASEHLHLVGRRKDVIVTPGGKNIYPEDVEHAFRDVDADELVVFAANTLFPKRELGADRLVAVVRSELSDGALQRALVGANRGLADFKRVSGWVRWAEAFPRTASMKVKRGVLAEEVRGTVSEDELRGL